ncbi:MAG: phosphoribosyltransferase [Desulfobulbaceae bacterium]|nr:phosphoribosyltransferase [Desulfobulbaceae bacterium]HIJ78767.1 phosphoribosyltransferase [Deltaproteobacteria bacterium]
MAEKFKGELVSWAAMYDITRRLALQIADSGFRPDVIVAVARGGFVPARILCDFLGVTSLGSLRIVHYRAGAAKEKEARLVAPLNLDVRGKKVLVVDDIVDTGDTLVVAMAHLADCGAAAIRTAVVQTKKGACFTPDYVARKIITWRWIIYPWAVIEDLTGFLKKERVSGWSKEQIEETLFRLYGIKVTKKIISDLLRYL